MKRSVFIAIFVSAIIVVAAGLSGCTSSGRGNPTPTATQAPAKTTTSILEQFDALKQKVNSSGYWFGGASTQIIGGQEAAMIYLYMPAGTSNTDDMLANGYSALYSVFGTDNPLLVGLIDMTQKINAQQYKVDAYSLDRSTVDMYLEGNITKSELVNDAMAVTNQTQNITSGGSGPTVTPVPTPNLSNYTAPPDRQAYLTESLNQSGYQGINLQTGSMQDGGKAVSLAVLMPANDTNAQKYAEIEACLKALAGAYGDYDMYYLDLASSQGNQYYVIEAGADAAIDFANGAINQYQLYNAINLTYYTG
jgi:hypothetical protein